MCNAYQAFVILGHVQSDCDKGDLCDFEVGLHPARAEWTGVAAGQIWGWPRQGGRADRQSFEKAHRRLEGSMGSSPIAATQGDFGKRTILQRETTRKRRGCALLKCIRLLHLPYLYNLLGSDNRAQRLLRLDCEIVW